jgi:DME family drug/metabolite transporter
MKTMNSRGSLAVVAAALLWTSAGWAGDSGRSGLPPIALAEARLLLGGGALLLWSGPRAAWSAIQALPSRTLLLAVGAMAVFQWGFFLSVRGLGSGTVLLLTTAIGPVAAQAVAAARDGSRLGRRWYTAVTLLSLAAAFAACGGSTALLGTLAAIASGTSYAVYAAVTAGLERGAGSEPRGLVTTGVALTGAGMLLAPFALRSTWPAPTPESLATLLYLGLAATALAYAFFASGLRVLAADRALSLLAVQPVAALVGDVLLHRGSDPRVGLVQTVLVGAALTVRLVPWPLIPLRRRGAGTAPRDGSCTQCP